MQCERIVEKNWITEFAAYVQPILIHASLFDVHSWRQYIEHLSDDGPIVNCADDARGGGINNE